MGVEGIEPTRPMKETGFTDRGGYLNALHSRTGAQGFEPRVLRFGAYGVSQARHLYE